MENKFNMVFKISLLVILGVIAISLVYIATGLSDISYKIFDLTRVIINLMGD